MNDKIDVLEVDKDFRLDVRISHLVRLFEILTNTFGIKSNLKKYLNKLEGKDITASFPKLGKRFATIHISNYKLYPQLGKSENASAIVVFNMDYDSVIPIISDVIRTSDNWMGLLKLTFKYLLTGKVILKGNIFNAIRLIRVLTLLDHPMYEIEKENMKDKDQTED